MANFNKIKPGAIIYAFIEPTVEENIKRGLPAFYIDLSGDLAENENDCKYLTIISSIEKCQFKPDHQIAFKFSTIEFGQVWTRKPKYSEKLTLLCTSHT